LYRFFSVKRRQRIEQIKEIVESLKKDKLRNINLINFIENNPINSIERIENSLLIRGKSDRTWVYIKCSSEDELVILKGRLKRQDKYFAAIEDWMLPVLLKDKELLWDLSLIQFYLPDEIRLSKPAHKTTALLEKDAKIVYDNSEYRNYISIRYIKDRIRRGISRGLYENDKLVAWGLTQDDGGLGFLHVLSEVRRKRYGLSVMLSLIEEVRQAGKIPFAYIEKDNVKSINLVFKLGFIKHKNIHWFQIN
jgi:8-oxo-dGTP diphosphatase